VIGGVHVRTPYDEWGTPTICFDRYHRRFGFTLDAAAVEWNAVLPVFNSPLEPWDVTSWRDERVWCNPPFSNPWPFLDLCVAREHEVAALLLPLWSSRSWLGAALEFCDEVDLYPPSCFRAVDERVSTVSQWRYGVFVFRGRGHHG